MPDHNVQQRPIALFLPALNEGGAERVMVNLANAFYQEGHAVDLVLGQKKGPYLSEVNEGINVVDLGAARVVKSLFPLIRYLRKAKPKALLSTLTHANIVAVAAARLSSRSMPVIVREAALPTLYSNQTLGQGPKGFMRLAKWLYPKAAAVVCVSEGVKSEFERHLKVAHKVNHQVIYNPVISELLYNRASQNIASEHQPIFNKPVVLGVGRLSDEKDFATLIRSFALLRNKLDCNLLLLGSGILREELEALAAQESVAEHVHFAGFVANPYPYLAKASLFVLSSKSEGLPNSLIEALALKTPVVSTAIENGPVEILENGKWGEVVPIGQVDAMAHSMYVSLTQAVAPIPENNPWWNKFSKDAVVKQYLSLLIQK